MGFVRQKQSALQYSRTPIQKITLTLIQCDNAANYVANHTQMQTLYARAIVGIADFVTVICYATI